MQAIAGLFDLVASGAALYRVDTVALPLPVLAWMWAMRIVFFGGVIFFPRLEAVATVATMALTAILIFAIKGYYPTVPSSHIGASVHLALWLPLLVWLATILRRRMRVRPRGRWNGAARAWLLVVMGMILISLLFDVREVVLWTLAA